MLPSNFCVLCFLGVLTVKLQAEHTYEAKSRLTSLLLQNYSKDSKPVSGYRKNISITVGISLYLIQNLDDRGQILTTSLWIRQKWHDPRLTWNPLNFSSVKSIHVPVDKVWIPDIKVYNEVNRRKDSGLDQFHTRVVVNYTGSVMWMGPIVLQSSCQVNVQLFPYDTQTCKIKIGSWTYDGYSLDVIPENLMMDVSKSPSSIEWELVSTSVKRNVQYYPCCPDEPYPDVTYTIKMKRREQSYWMNFIFPGIFLTVMTMLTFVTAAPDTGERVSLVLTSLVSMFFFLKMIAERTPASDTIPLLSIYFVMLSFEIALIFYSVCVSLNAYHKHPALGDMSWIVRTVVLEKLGGFWGLTDERHSIRKKLAALPKPSQLKNLIVNKLKEDALPDPETVSVISANLESRPLNGNLHAGRLGNGGEVVHRASLSCSEKVALPGAVNGRALSITSTNSMTYRGRNASWLKNYSGQSSQRFGDNVSIQRYQTKEPGYPSVPCSCSALLDEMVATNERLLSRVREIIYVASEFDQKSAKKEHWLIAATILDRFFLLLFVVIFFVFTLLNFVREL